MRGKHGAWVAVLAAAQLVAGPGCGKSNLAPGGLAKETAAAAVMAAPMQAADLAGSAGESSTWRRSDLSAHTSRLMVGDEESLPLRGMQVHAQVDGFRARVVIDFFFENESPQTFEGTFKVRLPEGASPFFLAFGHSQFRETRYLAAPTGEPGELSSDYVLEQRRTEWIEPVVARMVPREKAAAAYSETVRRAVDPALLEWAGAGVFNARIYPIQPQKLHRVVLGYDVDLLRLGSALELSLPIPAGLPSSAVDVTILQMAGVNASVAPEGTVTGSGATEHHRLTNVQGQVVTVKLEGVGQVAITGSDAAVGPFFAARLEPELPVTRKVQRSALAVFAIDTSMSSNPDKFNVWLRLMVAILEENRDSMHEFAVLFFNVDTHWWRRELVANTPENVAALMAYANELALEGATDLGAALGEISRPGWLNQERTVIFDVFLLSDGAVTWGASDRYQLSRKLSGSSVGALFAYRTGMEGTDTGVLDHLARESGGAVFSVVGESEVAAAATAHRAAPWQLDAVTLRGAEDIAIAGRPRVVFPGQRLYLVGRGSLEVNARAMFELSRAGVKKQVSVTIGHVLRSQLAPRAYGQIAVGQLEEFLGSTESFAGAYARHFRIVGETTSLLMLDSEADYQRHNIRPADDAGVVSRTRATTLVAEALAELERFLGDAKHAFLATARLPNALRDSLQGVSGVAFSVDSPGLAVVEHSWKAVGTQLRPQLAAREPGYDDVVREARDRRGRYGAGDALVALSSLVEASPGDAVLARDVGFTAMSLGLHGHAYHLFRGVAAARPFEPQSYWSMALALSAIGKRELALAYFEIAMTGEWDARFGPFSQIVSIDYLRFLRGAVQAELDPALVSYAQKRLRDLQRQIGVPIGALVVTITWNTDNTDVDLHVIEPSGEECFYQHTTTRSGGTISQDVTQGYGPEMFVHDRAPAGSYKIRVKYFASDVNRASARTKVYATVIRGWGTSGEQVTQKVVTLETGKEMHDIGTISIKK